jgi:hypothetical protein
VITYKGCIIFPTETRLASPNPRENTRRLYAIGGRLSKGPARPFLTSVASAKDWINEQDLGSGHAQARAIVTPQGRYASAGLAAAATGISRQAALKRAAHGTAGWRFEETQHGTTD